MILSNYLQTHNLTYQEFGDLVGVTGTAVYRYTAGIRFPRPRVMAKIKNVTNGDVTYDDFTFKSKTKPKKLKSTTH